MKKRIAILAGIAFGLRAFTAGADEMARVFDLGEILVLGTERENPAASATARIPTAMVEQRALLDFGEVLGLLPAVSPSRSGARNEILLYVRGFDPRQVPVFVDGIPTYLPYEGSVDLGRFLVPSLAEATVCRGFSPACTGPNALGGAINVLTRRPSEPHELELRAGAFSGGWEGKARGGWRTPRGYGQLGWAWRQRDYFRLSRNFSPAGTEDGGRRENSSLEDRYLDGRVGWLPDPEREWTLGFARVDSRKDVPPYAGRDTTVAPRYWRYPEWEKDSVYVVGSQPVGPSARFRARVHYEVYRNILESFDDATYRTQTRPYAFTSYYDDSARGCNAELSASLREKHECHAALHWKRDLHQEHLRGRPESRYEDDTFSAGWDDVWSFADRWTLAFGVAGQRRENRQAINRDPPMPETFSSPTRNVLLPQAGVFYDVGDGTWRATVARKARFPTLKERYSYRLGLALPNARLEPETATHYELGYEGSLAKDLRGRLSLFVSRVDDAIQRVDRVRYDETTETWLYQLQNVGEAEHRGAEAGLEWGLADSVRGGVDYAFLERRNLSCPDLKPTDTPEHRLRGWLEWRIRQRVVLLPDVEYDSWRWATSRGGKLGGFWLVGVHLRVTLPKNVELGCGVRNLLDEDYELAEGYPEEGRNYYAQVTANL